MEMIFLCSAAAAAVGAAAGYLYAVHERVEEIPEWPELLEEQQKALAAFDTTRPRAVTTLTNRTKTVQI